ncbi:Hypothetical protein MCYN_0615 [Mycoplasmopsis cynos C142]|uniref:Uncharacterized protein n=1 Tax=Mycoplasmopsis cynos (strain C142) TaxID=1246955 RepID=L0RW20_MYCC1|nr:Hypothetical protein MCYN_0615 [Mycoplasmopsis cynos C142]
MINNNPIPFVAVITAVFIMLCALSEPAIVNLIIVKHSISAQTTRDTIKNWYQTLPKFSNCDVEPS